MPVRDDAYGDTLGKDRPGFSLHAGVAAKAHQRNKLERLCRYIARPAVCDDCKDAGGRATHGAVAEKRPSLTAHGKVQYRLKTPYRDGTTPVFFEPRDFIARLAALAPKPRVHLTRFHGVFAPHSHRRAQVVPGRCHGNKAKAPDA